MSSTLDTRAVWATTPPDRRTRLADHPTLLYSWWATCFAAVVILTRLAGRKTRSNKLFREDWIMFLALVPLFARMAFVHLVLIYGTNNVTTIGVEYTAEEIKNREFGSKLVLAARIFYALFIWMSKWTVSEFLKRITIHLWRTSYEFTLHCIRIFLVATFIAVVIATLAECQPFSHYWQVVPDPGPQCRQNYAQLITMGTADIITDILLIAFPIPIVLRSGQNWKRKLQLAALFSTSIALIIITGMRVPEVIANLGRQQYRTIWASSEILASAFVSNIVVIGSFLRDKGTKKNKWKSTSISDSIDRASQRRPTMAPSTGSEEDLFRTLGCRMPDYLHDSPGPARPAPVVLPSSGSLFADKDQRVDTPGLEAVEGSDGDVSPGHRSIHNFPLPSPSPSTATGASPRKNVSFFDVGGLLENGSTGTPSPSITHSRSVTIVSSGASHTIATDFATSMHTPPQSRRSSRAFLSDMGAILTPSTSRSDHPIYTPATSSYVRRGSLPNSRLHNAAPPTGVLGPMLERQETQISLQDAGGLLTSSSPATSQSDTQPTTHRTGLHDDDEDTDSFDLTSSRSNNNNNNSRSTRLQDLGSFLASNRRTDLDNNIEMRRFDVRNNLRMQGRPPPAVPTTFPRFITNNNNNNNRSASSPASYESMNLHDPGGLLRR
jgi:hypothetical protein